MEGYHAAVVGKGAPLLFLPASGFTGIEGLNIAEALAEQYESHLLDLPGAGKSSDISGRVTSRKIADWVKAYIDAHGFEKVVLVGHSMGAGLAICFASEYPELVERLVLLDYGHRKMPLFPVKDLGGLGLVFPLINVLDFFFGTFLVKQVKNRMFTDEAEQTEEELEHDIKRFCKRFNVEPTPFVR